MLVLVALTDDGVATSLAPHLQPPPSTAPDRQDGEAPLHRAATAGRADLASFLLSRGAAVDLKDSAHQPTQFPSARRPMTSP